MVTSKMRWTFSRTEESVSGSASPETTIASSTAAFTCTMALLSFLHPECYAERPFGLCSVS